MPKSASEASGTKSIGEPTMVWHIAQTLWTATSLAGAIFWAGAAAAFIFLTAVFRVGHGRRKSSGSGISKTLATFYREEKRNLLQVSLSTAAARRLDAKFGSIVRRMLLVVGAASFPKSTLSSLRARTTPPGLSSLPTHVRVSMRAPVEELHVEELGAEAPLAELARLVARLGAECPWTRAQNTTDVVRYTRAELLEVEQAASRSSHELGDEANAEELADEQTDELTDELGDVLFNALLLIEVARRERPQLSVDTSAAAAVRKLRRRAPHLSNRDPTSS